MMSSAANGPQPQDPQFTGQVIARLMVHIAAPRQGKTKSTKKDMKTKEFPHTFCTTKANYVELLNAVLSKHHISNKFRVMERWCYGCKIQVPPAKYVHLPNKLGEN
jgi:hypothetical protein